MANKCVDACYCRNLICAIVFLTIGAAFVVAGGVIAAVGFGTRPKDMFDYANLSMRVIGLCLAGISILPIIMGAMLAAFYCAHKRGKLPGQKQSIEKNVVTSVTTKQNLGRHEYPYPADGGPLIYKPGSIPDDSLIKYSDYEKDDQYPVPLNQSGRISDNGLGTSHVYSEVKAPAGGGMATTTTTTTTKVYKTDTLDSNPGSGNSSGVTFNVETLPEMKAKRQKNRRAAGKENSSSETSSFNESSVPLQPKANPSKKLKKKEPIQSTGDDVFDDAEEPLPGGGYMSYGNDSIDNQDQVPKPYRSTGSPSFEQESELPSVAVYGKVNKKRIKKDHLR